MEKVTLNPAAIARYKQAAEATRVQGVGATEKAAGKNFGTFLTESLEEANRMQSSADKTVSEYISGKGAGLHETMIALEKADISMRLVVQVRNKAMEAYKEIMRMQV